MTLNFIYKIQCSANHKIRTWFAAGWRVLRFLWFAAILRIANLRLFRIAESQILRFCDSCDSQNRKFCDSCESQESQIVRLCDSCESQNRKLCDSAIHVNRRIAQLCDLRFMWIAESHNLRFCDSQNAIIAILRFLRISESQIWRICDSYCEMLANMRIRNYWNIRLYPASRPENDISPSPSMRKMIREYFDVILEKQKKILNMGQRM